MQALVLRSWEDGHRDVWVTRETYPDVNAAEAALNNVWNRVIALVDVKDIHSSDVPVTIRKIGVTDILCYYDSMEAAHRGEAS